MSDIRARARLLERLVDNLELKRDQGYDAESLLAQCLEAVRGHAAALRDEHCADCGSRTAEQDDNGRCRACAWQARRASGFGEVA